MKRNLAFFLTLAMVLSLAVAGLSFTASAATTDYATSFANELWSKVKSSSYVTKVTFRATNSDGATINIPGVTINAGETLDMSKVSVGNITGGTIAVSTEGVITVSNLTYSEEKNEHQMLIWGAAKVVLVNSVWRGNLRGDWADSIANADKTALVPLLVTSNDGSRVVSDFDNAFRACDSIVVYGKIGVDTTKDAFYISEGMNYTGNLEYRGIAVMGALEDSSIALKTENTAGNWFFCGFKNTETAASAKVILAGDKTSAGKITIDLNNRPLTKNGKEGSSLEIIDASVEIIGGEVVVDTSVTVSGDSNVTIDGKLAANKLVMKDTAVLSVKENAVEDTTGVAGTAKFNVNGQLVAGGTSTSTDTNTNTGSNAGSTNTGSNAASTNTGSNAASTNTGSSSSTTQNPSTSDMVVIPFIVVMGLAAAAAAVLLLKKRNA